MSVTVRFADGAVVHRGVHDAESAVAARGEALAEGRRVVREFGGESEVPVLLETSLQPHGSVREVYRVPGEGVLRVEVTSTHEDHGEVAS